MTLKLTLFSQEKEDFVLEILIDSDARFSELHRLILEDCNYEEHQRQSFLICDDEWRVKQRVSLLDTEDVRYDEDINLMSRTRIGDFLEDEGQRLAYIFDPDGKRFFLMELTENVFGRKEEKAIVNRRHGQPPLQTYVKPCKVPHIVLRSIDLGAMEVVETYEQLSAYNQVGSPFSIPKAACALAGFLPAFSQETFPTLRAQLESFGCGIELTLLSAIPAGSGLGTSSILAATVLGAISDFCSLAWDKNEIGKRTLILEQLLTTGGGWQDQFGGVLGGVKLLETQRGFDQNPVVRWLPDSIYTQLEYQQCHLLYYTGITRTAKKILGEIVRRMFLNHRGELAQLRSMKAHAMDMYEAIQRQDFHEVGMLVRKTWEQNQLIDSGTNPDSVRRITDLVDDLCLGYKLPGAGGGGYLYMVAKDPEAAARIKQKVNAMQPNANARFVDMTLSKNGLQVSRS